MLKDEHVHCSKLIMIFIEYLNDDIECDNPIDNGREFHTRHIQRISYSATAHVLKKL